MQKNHQTAIMLAEAIEMVESMNVKNVKVKRIENYQQTKQSHLIFMNKTLIFTYELLKFTLVSVPLASTLYVTASLYYEIKRILK